MKHFIIIMKSDEILSYEMQKFYDDGDISEVDLQNIIKFANNRKLIKQNSKLIKELENAKENAENESEKNLEKISELNSQNIALNDENLAILGGFDWSMHSQMKLEKQFDIKKSSTKRKLYDGGDFKIVYCEI
ncbi:MAG: hypothetical protein K5978_02965 [Campylobacter sp.]|nr:hypothetical protein [Campylobacter sp.]